MTPCGQDGSGHVTFPEPTDEVHLAHARAQSAEERGRRRVGELRAAARTLSDSDQDQEKRPARTFGTPSVDGQEMPERGFVVHVTDASAAKPGIGRNQQNLRLCRSSMPLELRG